MKRTAPKAGQAARPGQPAKNEVEVVNLATLRAQRATRQPFVVDQNGQKHYLAGLTVDTYLAMLEINQLYATIAEGEEGDQAELMAAMRQAISAALPGFPVGGLYFDELPLVLTAIQNAILPAGAQAEGDGAAPGK